MAKDKESQRLEIAERNARDIADAQEESDSSTVRNAAKGTKQEAEGIKAERDHHEGKTK